MKYRFLLLTIIASNSVIAEEKTQANCCDNICCFPPQFYDLECDCGLFFSVDFLYWYASENGISYAAKATTTGSSPSSTFSAVTRLEHVGVNWDPGLRLGVGVNLPHDGWDLYLNWTYFKNTQKSTSSVSPFENIDVLGVESLSNPWLINPSLYPAFDRIKAKWQFTLNQLDLELGRRFWLSPCFNTRPYIAIRGAWTETIFNLDSSRSGGSFGNNIINASADDVLDNCFWGIGFLAGFQPTWYFTSCIGLYGTIDLALLWGDYNFKHKVKTTQALVSTGAIIRSFSVDSTAKFSQMQAIFDIGLGLRYENTLCDKRYRINFDLGWEHHAWFDLNYRFKISSSSTEGTCSFISTINSIGLGGLVLRGRLDF